MTDTGGNGSSSGRGGGNGTSTATSARSRGGNGTGRGELYGVSIDRGQSIGVLRGSRGPIPAADPARTHRFCLAQVLTADN